MIFFSFTEDELHTLNLTLNDQTSPSSLTSTGGFSAFHSMTSSWRDRHRRNFVKFRLTDIPCCKRMDSSLHKSKKPFLPPDFRHSNEILKLIKVKKQTSPSFDFDVVFFSLRHQDKQRKLFHINDYDNPTRLKECYVRLCRNLSSYNAEIYVVKELHGKRSKRKVCFFFWSFDRSIDVLLFSSSREIDFCVFVRIKFVFWI